MRRSRELIVLVVLLLGTVAFVLWYVADRRARQAATPVPKAKEVGPVTLETPAAPQPLDLESVDGKTVDLSTGRPVVRETPEDRAAMEAALKEMAEATKDVTFEPPAPGPKK